MYLGMCQYPTGSLFSIDCIWSEMEASVDSL